MNSLVPHTGGTWFESDRGSGPTPEGAVLRRLRRGPLGALAVFMLLIVVMMWPQVRHITDRATAHQDVYFNMWRLAWIAHALSSSPSRLLDGNIFYPERRTLTFSDAMLVEGVMAAPLIWMGLKPVLVHNLMMLGAIAVSALGLFMLVHYLTGSRGGALLAGVIFAFAPYRYEHIMHMELQWTMWMPWAFLALHRTLDTGRWRYGIATGLAVTLQMLSSIYYGIFLATLLAFSACLLVIRDRGVPFRRAVTPLVAGAVLAAFVCALYALPYLRTRDEVGERPSAEVVTYSARPASYLAATPTNWLYGGTNLNRGGAERRLFPGTLAVLLAMIGLLLPSSVSRRQIVYLLAMVAAFEMSLGFRGYSYTALYDYVSVYRGLRAAARLGIFVVMFLGVLAAYGYAAMATSLPTRTRRVLLAALLAGMLAEYWCAMPLVEYPNAPSGVYRVLAQQPRGAVVEFPIPRYFPGREAEYAYMSTFHWMPLLNGYSGMFPKSYLMSLARLRSFPHPAAIGALRRTGIRYVIVHGSSYKPQEFEDIRFELARQPEVAELGLFQDAYGPAALYILR
jgi:hypothetical protein